MLNQKEVSTLSAVLIKKIFEHYKKKLLGNDYQTIFKEYCKRTGNLSYIVGENVFYSDGTFATLGKTAFPAANTAKLHDDLYQQHAAWWRERQEVTQNQTQVDQVITSLLMRATTYQDVRDMFPEYVIGSILGETSRVRPDVFPGNIGDVDYQANLEERLLHWDPHLIKLYSRVGGMIAVYLGYRFL